jgi:hypothetical protein
MGLIREWSDFVKTSSRWNFRSKIGKIMMGLVLAGMIGSMDVVPAIAKDKDDRREGHDNGRYEKNRGRGYDRDRHQQRPVYRTYGYRERVYVPPPVLYVPPPPPGISIFFPPIFFRP